RYRLMAICGYYGDLEIDEEIAQLRELGIRGLKFKIGGRDPATDAKRMVNATSEWPMRSLRAFQSILASRACRGVAVANVVQADLGQPGCFGQPVESASDRVRMRRFALLPAEQQPVVLVVRPELAAFVVKHPGVRLEDRERERVERDRVLRVLCFAVRVDHS